jgi:hypothetical protein
MATITPNTDGPISTAKVVNWTGIATGGTSDSVNVRAAFRG